VSVLQQNRPTSNTSTTDAESILLGQPFDNYTAPHTNAAAPGEGDDKSAERYEDQSLSEGKSDVITIYSDDGEEGGGDDDEAADLSMLCEPELYIKTENENLNHCLNLDQVNHSSSFEAVNSNVEANTRDVDLGLNQDQIEPEVEPEDNQDDDRDETAGGVRADRRRQITNGHKSFAQGMRARSP